MKMFPKPPKASLSILQLAQSSCRLMQPGWQQREEP